MRLPVVIGLSGKRGSGKDTLAAQMAPLGWKRISFAEDLKLKCRADFGLTEEQTDGALKESPTQYIRTDGSPFTPRDIMVRCGFYYRSIDNMFWVKRAYKEIEQLGLGLSDDWGRLVPGSEVHKFVITDVRFKNEANYIREHGGIVIRLERDKELNIYTGNYDDPSETELDAYAFDQVLGAKSNVCVHDLTHFAMQLEECYAPR